MSGARRAPAETSGPATGTILSLLRQFRGMSRRDLARATRIPESRLGKIENAPGEPDARDLYALLSALGVRPSAVAETRALWRTLTGQSGPSGADAPTPDGSVGAEAEAAIVRAEGTPYAGDRARQREDAATIVRQHGSVYDFEGTLERWRRVERWTLAEHFARHAVSMIGDRRPETMHWLAERAVKVADGIVGDDPWIAKLRAYVWAHLGEVRAALGRFDTNEAFDRSAAYWQIGRAAAPFLLDESGAVWKRAAHLFDGTDSAAAYEALEEVLTISDGRVKLDAYLGLASIHVRCGRLARALDLTEQAAEFASRTFPNDEYTTLKLERDRAELLVDLGRIAEADATIKAAARGVRKRGSLAERTRTDWLRARVLGSQKKPALAIEILQTARQKVAAGNQPYEHALVVTELAHFLVATGASAEADALAADFQTITEGIRFVEVRRACGCFTDRAARGDLTLRFLERFRRYLRLAEHAPSLKFRDSLDLDVEE